MDGPADRGAVVKLPAWVSPLGLLEHVVVGTGVTLLNWRVAILAGFPGGPVPGHPLACVGTLPPHLPANWFPPLVTVLALLTVGLVHEQGQQDAQGRYWSDFRLQQANGGTWTNGTLCLLSFMLPALVWWAFS